MTCIASSGTPMDVVKGDDISFDCQFVQPDERGINAAYDISDYDITFTFPGQASDVVLTSNPANGVTKTDPTKGLCQVVIEKAVSATLRKGERQTFYATLVHTTSSEETTVKFKDIWNVEERDFR